MTFTALEFGLGLTMTFFAGAVFTCIIMLDTVNDTIKHLKK